jgi:hypothetical protein
MQTTAQLETVNAKVRKLHGLGNQQPSRSSIIADGSTTSREAYTQAGGNAGQMERFWSKTEVLANGCIIWKAARNVEGYGVFALSSKRKNVRAHHVAWMLAGKGEIPRGQILRHTCDTSSCVNVAHLALGTQADNIADKVLRNRQARGEGHGMSKLNEDQVREIRASIGPGHEIGKRFGVSSVMVNFIRARKSWTHI